MNYLLIQTEHDQWSLTIYAKGIKWQRDFKKYIDALEVVQTLQLHLNENDKQHRPHRIKLVA